MKIIGVCYLSDIWPEPDPAHPANATRWRGTGPFVLMDIFKMMALDTNNIEFTTDLRYVY